VEDVEAAERLHGVLDHALHGFRIRDIGDEMGRLATAFAQRRGDALGAVAVDVHHHHLGALLLKAQCGGFAYP